MKAVLSILLLTMTFSAANADFLDKLRWRHRVLILDFPEGSANELATLEKQIRNKRAGIKDRDLVIYHIGELGSDRLRGVTKLREGDRRSVRRQLGLKDSSTTAQVFLIGKDGGTKTAQAGGFDLQKLFDLIDTMPMRKREMEGK